jgi:tRNA 2-thiouridine synthesizing protein E
MRTTTVTLAGKTVEVDEEGYLMNRADWNEEIAKEMAARDNCELTPDHWEVINFQREYYEENQIYPNRQVLLKAMSKRLGADKGNSKYLYELFPYGANQANKYAGLPKLCQDP